MPWICAAFVMGIIALQQQAVLPALGQWAALLAAVVVSLALAWRLRRGKPWFALALSAAACALLGFAYAAAVAQHRLADELAWADQGRDILVSGVVVSLPQAEARSVQFEFEVEEVLTPGVHVPARVSLSWFGQGVQVVPAQRWQLTVRLRRPHGSVNPGGFDFEAWMLERGLRASGHVRAGAQRLDDRVFHLAGLLARARYALRERLESRLGERPFGGVLVALVLGDQRAIDAAQWTLFAQSGISHLVSISGLHITMISGLVAWCVSGLWRRWPRTLALAPAQSAAALAAVCTALSYSLLAGWGVPAQRTFLMLTVVAIALTRRQPTSGPTSLMLAAVVVCLADPWAVIAPGFWLSFGAVAAIMWAMSGQMNLAAQLPVWRQRLRSAVRVQLAVSLALIPMTIALFAQVSLISPVANAVAIPVVSCLVTPIALLAALLSVLPEPLAHGAGPLLALAHGLFAWLVELLQHLVQLPKAAVAWAVPPMWTLVCAMLGVAWLWAPRGWPLRAVGLVWLLPAMVWPPQRPAADELWLTALDVGQGTAVVLQTQDATALYDTGARFSEQTDAGSRVIAPYFRYRGIDALDLLVVSHLDSDHSGGAVSVMAAVKTQQLLTSIDLNDATHVAFARGAQRSERCVAGRQGRLGAASWQLLHPSADDYEAASRLRRPSTNRLSCVMMLRFGPHRVLLAGDILKAQEKQLLARSAGETLGPVTVLFAPHHGSHSSSSLDWALATSPKWVAYTVGYRNRFGHPHEDILARYAALGAQAARTDLDGAITWRLRADGALSVVRARQAQRRYWHNVAPRLGADV